MTKAVNLQREGRLDEAAQIYRQVLTESPRDFDATQLLGVVALQQGDHQTAQRLLAAALQMHPSDTSVMANLGTSHLRTGQYDRALQLFESALELQPDSSMWNANLGTVLYNLGRYGDAIPPLRKARSLDPDSDTIRSLLATCLVRVGDKVAAVALFEAATQADPGNPEGWEQLALASNALGQHQEARESAGRALELNPRSSVAFAALGHAQFAERSLEQAVDSYKQAVALAPPSADLFAAYGNALAAQGLHDEAILEFTRALNLDGSRLDVRWAMAMTHLKPVYASESESAAARHAFARALADIETLYRQSHHVREPFTAVGTLQPFYLAYQPVNNRELLDRYGKLCASWMSTLPVSSSAVDGAGASDRMSGADKLRIGIVSSHVHEHSVWNAITRGWVYQIDAERFEIHVFKLDAWSDPETDRAKGAVAYFDDRQTDLHGWIRLILGRHLDVIIYPEIGMHALTLQLASLRLAPVQAAAWGHPETTGLPTMDLYLSADGLEPPDASGHYVEELVRLPNLGVYVAPLAPAMANPGFRSLNLSRSEQLLLCPGVPFKYAPMYDNVWVQIAARLKRKAFRWHGGGRLVFFRSRNPLMDRLFEQRLRAAFEAGGVDFDARVSIVPALERSRFFGLMQRSTLMLDTPGFSGFNTALQAIECALPVLAFEGEFMRGRFASAIMLRLGLPELVVKTPESFVDTALQLSADAGLRNKLRALIVERRYLLFHDITPVRALEQRLNEAVAKARAHAGPRR